MTTSIFDPKCCFTASRGYLDLRPDNMLFGGLQPPVATSTFNPTTCCLVDYSLQWISRPSTRQHAVCQTTASSGYLDLRPDNMLFVRLQPPVATSTFDPTSCCLTDYSLQWLPRPSTRQHAVCQTTASSGYLDLRPDIMLFDRLQPPVATSTFDPTTCYLVDYSLQWLPRPSTRHAVLQPPVATSTFDPTTCCLADYILQWLLQPSSRHHAVCQTTASSGYIDLRPDIMLFVRLQPPVATSTFDPTTCCLADYNLQWLPRPSTRQHAVWHNTATSGYLDLRLDNMLFDRLQPPVATSIFDPKCCFKASRGNLDLRPDNMLFGGLQPPVATSTFDPTTCCLTDYSLQWLPRPSTRQHAV